MHYMKWFESNPRAIGGANGIYRLPMRGNCA